MKKIVTLLFAAVMLLFSSQAQASAPATALVTANSIDVQSIDAEVLLDSIVATEVISTADNDFDWVQDHYSQRSNDNWFRSLAQLIICVCAILAFPAFVIIIIVVLLRNKRNMLMDKYQVIEHAMRQGYPLPEAFYFSSSPRYDDYRRLRSALIWIACGLSILSLGAIADARPVLAVGTLPLFVGIAKLVVYLVARHDNNSNHTGSEQDADQN